jgi:hypothetical protein
MHLHKAPYSCKVLLQNRSCAIVTLFCAGTYLVIIKATILQQTMCKVIYKFLSIYMYPPFAIFPYTNPPERWKRRNFIVFPSFILCLWAPYARHMKGTASAHPTRALQAIYIRFSCYGSCRHVKCLLLFIAAALILHIPAVEQLVSCWKGWERVDVLLELHVFYFNRPCLSLAIFSGSSPESRQNNLGIS